MFSSSRIPVPRSAKRTPVETTLTIANNESPSQLKAARFNGGIHSPAKVAHPIAAVVAAANASPSIGVRRLSLAPTSKSPLATPPQRRSGSQRLSMYGVPHALGGERKATSSGLRRSATGTLMMASSPERERRIVVCVRKRPLSTKEGRLENEDCVTTDMNNNFIRVNVLRTKLDGLGKYYEDFEFGFDKVYDETCSNTLLYEQIVGPLIDFCLLGGKATCFAYGQTGSGKTHTMFHPKDGLCYEAIVDLMNRATIDNMKVYISFFEIYQSQLYDLLRERKRVVPCEKGDGQVKIMGLEEEFVKSPEQAKEIIQRGLLTRMTGKTGANSQSSRSHAILQFSLRSSNDKEIPPPPPPHNNDNNDGSTIGRISFIDLAGSERGADRAEVDRRTKLEGSEINKSLLALKECIRALDMEASHLPFRQSKLTLVLKDSIVGNVRTAMIATVSPAVTSCEHTLNTLRYAERFHEISGGGGGLRNTTSNNSNPTTVDYEESIKTKENTIYSDWNISPVVARKSQPPTFLNNKSSTLVATTTTTTTDQRVQSKRQRVIGTIEKLQQQVKTCEDPEVLELLDEELGALLEAFQSLA